MAVDSITSNLAPQISGAIRKAAQSTGISFNYLLTTAQNRIQPQPDGPGLDLVGHRAVPVHRADLARHRQAGRARRSGSGQYASAISKSSDGRYTVADPETRAGAS